VFLEGISSKCDGAGGFRGSDEGFAIEYGRVIDVCVSNEIV